MLTIVHPCWTLQKNADGGSSQTIAERRTIALTMNQTTPPTPSARPAADAPPDTSQVIQRFNDAFQRHDSSGLTELIAEDCVLENTQPAPNGSRHVGREACFAVWHRIATTPGTYFVLEEVIVNADRAVILWRFCWGDDDSQSVRGVNLMRIRDGLIVEALGYVKGGS
jgi:ketosteroid isomerase-like protein